MDITSQKYFKLHYLSLIILFSLTTILSFGLTINEYYPFKKFFIAVFVCLVLIGYIMNGLLYAALIYFTHKERKKYLKKGRNYRRFQFFIPFTGDFSVMDNIIISYLEQQKFKHIYYGGNEPMYVLNKKYATFHRYFTFMRCDDGYFIQAFIKPYTFNPRIRTNNEDTLYGFRGFLKKGSLRAVVNDVYCLIISNGTLLKKNI